jgi:HK97 family phage portal protein
MNVISALLGNRVEKRYQTIADLDALFERGTVGETGTGVEVSAANAMMSAVVYACVQVLSQDIASLPLITYRRLPNGGKERAYEHPLYDILHERPNQEMTSYELRTCLVGHQALWGNAYCEIERSDTRINGLWPLRPDRMTVQRDDANELIYVYRLPNGQTKVFPFVNIMHWRGLSSNGIIGYSPIQQAAESVGVDLATRSYGARFFGNNSQPGGVLKSPKGLSEPAAKRLKDTWEDAHRGLSNAQRVAVLEEGVEWQQVGIPPEQAQFLETRKYTRTEIAAMYRIAPHKIGDLERATFCLPADVEVFTADGPKSIATVRHGDKVWSPTADGLVLATVEHAGCTGEDTILEIKTTNRTLRANAKHRVLVRRKHADPQAGKGGYQHFEWEDVYVPAGELRVGDTLVVLDSIPPTSGNTYGERNLSFGFMEFCGLLLGDGNVNKGSVTIARAATALYMDHYRKVIRHEFVSFGSRGNGKARRIADLAPVAVQEGERQTRFSSVLAAEELRLMGLGGDARSKRVPGWVFQVAPELQLAFLRGFLDADGSVDKKGRISYASVNPEMLSQIRHICMALGVPVTNLRRQAIRTKLPNGRMFDGESFTFTCSDPGANRRIWSHDPRYQQRLTDGKPFGRKGRNYPDFGGAVPAMPGCGLARVVSIKEQPAEPVYDLTVAGTHSFIANGVVVHNSNIEEQNIDHWQSAIRPWLVQIEQALTRDLFRISSGKRAHFAEHMIEGLLRGNSQGRATYLNTMRNAGVINADEWRAMDNLNPIPGGKGKIYWQPANMLELGAKPAPPPVPAPPSPAEDDAEGADEEAAPDANEADDETTDESNT